MPHSTPKQPVAAFLNIKRRQGVDAAKKFASKHRADMAKGAKAAHNQRPYKPRSK